MHCSADLLRRKSTDFLVLNAFIFTTESSFRYLAGRHMVECLDYVTFLWLIFSLAQAINWFVCESFPSQQVWIPPLLGNSLLRALLQFQDRAAAPELLSTSRTTTVPALWLLSCPIYQVRSWMSPSAGRLLGPQLTLRRSVCTFWNISENLVLQGALLSLTINGTRLFSDCC